MEKNNNAMQGDNSTKVLLIDDHPLFRKGIAQTLLDLSASLQIVEAATAHEAFEQIQQQVDIDCIFLDLQLPDMSGLHFLAELKRRRIPIPVIILTANEEAVSVERCLNAGANGYLSKAAAADEIADALSALQNTRQYVARALRKPLDNLRAGISGVNRHAAELTLRQQQVLQHLADGLSNQQIADVLEITESTIKGHVSTLFTLINVDNRIQCVSAARAQGLVK